MKATTLSTVRLLDYLPEHPMLTVQRARQLLDATSPTTGKAIDVLCRAGVLEETTGKRRDRVYVYRKYLTVLSEDTGLIEE